jgi:hypothetical protein
MNYALLVNNRLVVKRVSSDVNVINKKPKAVNNSRRMTYVNASIIEEKIAPTW